MWKPLAGPGGRRVAAGVVPGPQSTPRAQEHQPSGEEGKAEMAASHLGPGQEQWPSSVHAWPLGTLLHPLPPRQGRALACPSAWSQGRLAPGPLTE